LATVSSKTKAGCVNALSFMRPKILALTGGVLVITVVVVELLQTSSVQD
jgi:hypothetical protein